MKSFYIKSVLFWFVLLGLALVNAAVREATYKPFLTPYIGIWAHQISSVTGILLFFGAIYMFLSTVRDKYTKEDVFRAGLAWVFMTLVFETFMNVYMRHLSFSQVLATYAFWTGETWIFVLLSLVVSPLIIYKILKK